MKNFYTEDTITALSTPYGLGGIAIIRISGKDSVKIAEKLYKSPSGKSKKITSYKAMYGFVINPKTGKKIDEAIFLPMLKPYSYTKEDVVEIQCHGGSICASEILKVICSEGARMAQPGEFTKRAFLNGRIDLVQAEAVMDIINAKSSKALENAMEQLSGKYSNELNDFKEEIIETIAFTEAPIDYPDEELYSDSAIETKEKIDKLYEKAKKMLDSAIGGKLYRDGAKVSLIGKPNAGKSSILNMLLKENRAIVTDIAGTTRDIIEESCVIDSIPVTICDTAGIRETDSEIEKLGIEKTKEAIDTSDLIITVIDSSNEIDKEDEEVLKCALNSKKDVIFILNKTDLPTKTTEEDISKKYNVQPIKLSTKSLEGREEIIKEIGEILKKSFNMSSTSRFTASHRHIECLEAILKDLKEASDSVANGYPLDLCTIPLRGAITTLEELTGISCEDEITDTVFSKFCIGK